MTYHLSKFNTGYKIAEYIFLIQIILDKNLFSPLSEFVILHTQILSNTDIFANSIQWFCFIINMIIVSLICKEFYLSRTLQMLSAFFVCSMPIAILQSSSTQNDLVLSTFILLFYYYQLSGINSDSNLNIFLSGLALGLGVLTKGTAYVFLFSIGIVYLTYHSSYQLSSKENYYF